MWALIIGLFIWSFAYIFKRVLPAKRANLDAKFGAGKARGILTALFFLSIILMVIGYRAWDASALYTPPAGLKHIAMLFAWIGFILLGLGHSKSRLKTKIRHPMLTGFALWAVAHLLVRGDWASVWLFGGLLIWAVGSILLFNAQDGAWQKPSTDNLSLKGDIRIVVIGSVLTAIAVLIHIFAFGLIS